MATAESPITPVVGINERLYEPTKLASVYDVLLRQGHSPEDALKGVGLNVPEVHSPDTRISLAQLMTAYRNAMSLSTDLHLPYRIGATIHVSAYGLYGYAILCSPDFRKAIDFSIRYHLLASPLAEINLTEEGEYAIWSIEPNSHTFEDQRLYRFVLEKQIGIHISLMRDIMGPRFVPREIHLSYAKATDFNISSSEVGCEIRHSQTVNKIIFQREWLDQEANLGNRTTYPQVVDLCNKLLADMTLRVGVAGQIREILLRDIANPPAFDAIATQLGSNDRSLRRALEKQGLSFRSLRDELRAQLALEYLRNTVLTNDDIAVALGFGDGAAFRRAFQRWTKQTPSQIRREGPHSRG